MRQFPILNVFAIVTSSAWLVLCCAAMEISRRGGLGPTSPGLPLVFVAMAIILGSLVLLGCFGSKRITGPVCLGSLLMHGATIAIAYRWLEEILYVA